MEHNKFEALEIGMAKSLEKPYQPKYHFIYRDNFDNRKIVFECDADNISEADEMLEEKTKIVASKANNIACSIEEN